MKVLFVTPWNTACGIATYSANLIEQLEKLDVDVSVFAETLHFTKLAKLARDCDADVVHFQHEFGISLPLDQLVSIIGKFRMAGTAVVITLHSEADQAHIMLDGVADAVILHNDVRNLHKQNTFSSFYKVPHGIPEIGFSEPKAYYRKKYGIPETAFVIGTCGFLAPKRAHAIENLMVKLAAFIGKHEDVYLHMVTSSHRLDADGSGAKMLSAALTNLAADNGFKGRIYVGTEFTENQEFRERLYTLDLGFASAPATAHSNSGAAADLVSAGVPVVVNASPHFQNLAPYSTVIPEIEAFTEMAKAIEEIYDNHDEVMPRLRELAKQAVADLGYSGVAAKHKRIYESINSTGTEPVKSNKVHAQIIRKDIPITISVPNKMWQLLILWGKLQNLVDDGYSIRFLLQADGLTEASVLKFVLDGIGGVDYADIGLGDDRHLLRLHSRSLSQNLTTDIRDWVKKESIHTLFPFMGKSQHRYRVRLGDYAYKKAKSVIGFGNVAVVNVSDAVADLSDGHWQDIAKQIVREGVDDVMVMGSPARRGLVDDVHKTMSQCFVELAQANLTPRKVVEDLRTRWAVAEKVSHVHTGVDEIGGFCLMQQLPTTYLCTESWQKQLVADLMLDKESDIDDNNIVEKELLVQEV